MASREDEACADKRTDSRARQHETLLRTFGGTTGTIGAHRCAPMVASWLASPAFAGFAFVAHLERGRDLAVLFFEHPPFFGERWVSLLMGDDYSDELQLPMQLIPCGANRRH